MSRKFKVQSLRFKVALRLCALACVALVVDARAATTNLVQRTNAPAATTNFTAITGTDFPSFKIIVDRNIFSANRSGHAAAGPTRKPTRVDTFTLVGTVDYAKGTFAIFDGSGSDYRKTLKIGDSLAGFTITDLDLDHVTISTNGADTVLHVGSQMRRVDQGDWALGSGPAPLVAKTEAPKTNNDAAATQDDSQSSDEPAPSPETNEILKKLMQKRKAEVKHETE